MRRQGCSLGGGRARGTDGERRAPRLQGEGLLPASPQLLPLGDAAWCPKQGSAARTRMI